MNLIPHDERPGLWVNKAWRPGTPGTFAVVIGVSDYATLDGGLKSLNLGKLPVSALSAFRFFEWLEDEYFVSGCPLAMCWLLVAPSKKELQVAPRMAQALSPDFAACDETINAWFDEMKNLPEPAAKESRSIFFFSGHGLEIIEDRQILLPRDYEPARNVDRALSSENISKGLKDLKVPLHFLFLDACRKDHDKLSEYTTLTGTKVLNEPSNKRINPVCKVPVFYASAAGTTAWSPDPTKGDVSVFGQALLEGLKANGLKPDCNTGTCFIYIHLLQPFMESRMREILIRYRSSELQEPQVRGDFTVKPVTELSGPQPQDWLPKGPEPHLDLGGPSLPGSGDAIGIPLQANTPGKISDDEMRAYLDGARVFNFSSKAWLPDGSIEITNLRHEPDTSLYEFDIRIRKAAKGQLYWLELSNKIQTVGCALPVDWVEQTVFHASLHAVSRPLTVTSLDITLSENSGGLLRKAMQLWQRSDRGILTLSDLQTSVLQTPFIELRSGIESHTVSSLGSMITASILSRTAQWRLLGEWVLALTTANPKMTDGAILWAERCLRQDEGPAIEPLKHFMLLDTATLPIFSYTVSLALRQAEYYSSMNTLPDPFKAAISRIHRRLARAIGTFRPGGLFASFIGKAGLVSSETLAPPSVVDEFREGLSSAVLKTPGGMARKVTLERHKEEEISFRAVAEAEIALQKMMEYETETAAAEAPQPEFTAETKKFEM